MRHGKHRVKRQRGSAGLARRLGFVYRCVLFAAIVAGSVAVTRHPAWFDWTQSKVSTHPSKATAEAASTATKAPSVAIHTPPSHTVRKEASLPAHALIRVPAQSQLPALPNGCEVTSLSMLLSAIGHPVDKMTLAKDMPKDPTPRVLGKNGTIVRWGNPNVGFVGNVYVHSDGYGIYHGPLTAFAKTLVPHGVKDLTGQPFDNLLHYVANGTPVEVWTTWTFRPTNNWVSWNSPTGPVKATMDEHAVLLVGYDANTLYINNPLNGKQAEPVPRGPFVAAWRQLGQQALTIQP